MLHWPVVSWNQLLLIKTMRWLVFILFIKQLRIELVIIVQNVSTKVPNYETEFDSTKMFLCFGGWSSMLKKIHLYKSIYFHHSTIMIKSPFFAFECEFHFTVYLHWIFAVAKIFWFWFIKMVQMKTDVKRQHNLTDCFSGKCFSHLLLI